MRKSTTYGKATYKRKPLTPLSKARRNNKIKLSAAMMRIG